MVRWLMIVVVCAGSAEAHGPSQIDTSFDDWLIGTWEHRAGSIYQSLTFEKSGDLHYFTGGPNSSFWWEARYRQEGNQVVASLRKCFSTGHPIPVRGEDKITIVNVTQYELITQWYGRQTSWKRRKK